MADMSNNLNNHSVALFENSESGIAADLSSGVNTYFTVFIYLIAIAAVIAGLLLLRKYLLNRLGAVKNGSYMRIVDRLAISQDKQIVMIELKSKILVVGITQQRIETLSEYSRDEFDVIAQNAENSGMQKYGGGFVQMLNDKLKTADKSNKPDENNRK